MTVSAAFHNLKLDELKLSMYEQFTLDSSLTLKSFLKVWFTCEFIKIYETISEREKAEFIRQLFLTTVESFSKCNGLPRRVFSLYLAASVFFTQPLDFKIPIKLTRAQFDDLIDLTTQTSHVRDVLATVQGLKSKNAWCLVHSHQTYGPKIKMNNKTTKVDQQLSQDRFNSLKNSLKEYVERVSQGHDTYEKLKTERNIDILDPTPDQVGEFFKSIDSINCCKPQSKPETKAEDIGMKRRNLKNKSVENQRKPSQSCETKLK